MQKHRVNQIVVPFKKNVHQNGDWCDNDNVWNDVGNSPQISKFWINYPQKCVPKTPNKSLTNWRFYKRVSAVKFFTHKTVAAHKSGHFFNVFQRKRWFAKQFFICSLSFLFIIAENFSRNNASEECGEQNPRNNSCVKAEQKEHCYGKRFFHCDTEKSCRYDCRTECRVKSAEHCNTVADAHSAEDDGEEVTAFPTRLYADKYRRSSQ